MDDNKKEFFMNAVNLLSGDLNAKEKELDDIHKSCRLITFIILVICVAVILGDYFIF